MIPSMDMVVVSTAMNNDPPTYQAVIFLRQYILPVVED
jgi:hypothetical protein